MFSNLWCILVNVFGRIGHTSWVFPDLSYTICVCTEFWNSLCECLRSFYKILWMSPDCRNTPCEFHTHLLNTSLATVCEVMEHLWEYIRTFGITFVSIFTYTTLLVIRFGIMSTPCNCLWNHGIILLNIYWYMEHPMWICMEFCKTPCECL